MPPLPSIILLFHLVFVGHLLVESQSNSACHNILGTWILLLPSFSARGKTTCNSWSQISFSFPAQLLFFLLLCSLSPFILIPTKWQPPNSTFYFSFLLSQPVSAFLTSLVTRLQKPYLIVSGFICSTLPYSGGVGFSSSHLITLLSLDLH